MRLLFIPDRRPMRRGVLLLVMAIFAVFALAGCSVSGVSRGAYPIDFFTEMHYAQSYRIQEPPSLSAPSASVPSKVGRGVGYVFDLSVPFASEVEYTLPEAQGLANPLAQDARLLGTGAQVYLTNCAVCHGESGTGDGPMAERLLTAGYGGTPANLTAGGPTVNKSDGEVYQIITEGFADTYGLPADSFVMPPFKKLLAAADRWALVHYIRSLQGG